MTPQEKAQELISKMNVIHYMKLGGKNKDSKGLPVSMHDDQIKQCALIAVDEIINCDYFFNVYKDAQKFTSYWFEVQNEIEKL